MEDFSNTLKKLRKEKGLTQSELAHKLDLRKTTISNYETNYSSPSNETLVKLAVFFGVTIDQLLGYKPVLREPDRFEKEEIVPYFIPILGMVHDGELLFANADKKKQLQIPSSVLPKGDYFALIMDTDEMDLSRIEKGDTIFVHRQSIVQNGDIAILFINHKQTQIGLYYQDESQITLMPNSTNKNNAPRLYQSNYQDVVILGKVVKAMITL